MSTNEPMAQEQLNEIQKRLDAATDGPWSVEYESEECPPFKPYAHAIHGPTMQGVLESQVSDDYKAQYGHQMDEVAGVADADAELIAHAPTDLADLLAEVHRLRAELIKARESLANLRCAVVSAARECGEWESKAEDAQRELAKAREVTDDMVERAAVQMCANGRNESIWKNNLYEEEREAFRKDARVALEAALGGGDDE